MSEDMKKDLMEDPEDEMLKAVMGSKFQDQADGVRLHKERIATPVCTLVRNDIMKNQMPFRISHRALYCMA